MIKQLLTAGLICAASFGAMADTQEIIWTYCNPQIEETSFGYGPDTYSVAAEYYNPGYAGLKLTKIDAYINADESLLKNMDNFTVFLTSELGGTPIVIETVEPKMSTINSTMGPDQVAVLSLELAEPYIITTKSFFAGYSLEVIRASTDAGRHPVLVDASAQIEGSCYIRTPTGTENQWNINGYSYGAATIYLTLERETSPLALNPAFPDIVYAEAGKNFDALMTVTNAGTQTVNSFTYSYSLNGGDQVTNTINLENPLAPSLTTSYELLLPMNAVAETGIYTIDFEITKVNGQPNGSAGPSTTGELDVFPYIPKHVPLMEEYTALSCGYCPRGFVAMEYIGEEYPDDAVVVCYHLEFGGNKDPMTVTGAAPVATTQYPTASIDRMKIIDPYYGDYETYGTRDLGIVDDIFRRARQVAIADISVADIEVTDNNKINVTTNATFMKQVENDKYRIGYVLSCNGLYDQTWKQTNYFSKDSQFSNTPLIDQFVSLPSSVYGLTFNDVAIITTPMRGVANSVTSVVPETPVVHNYTFDISDVKNIYGDSLNKYLDLNNMWVNAFIIDRVNGAIVNACKAPVVGSGSRVESFDADELPVSTVYYDLTGRKVNNPDKGIFIKSEILENGKVRTVKVVR